MWYLSHFSQNILSPFRLASTSVPRHSARVYPFLIFILFICGHIKSPGTDQFHSSNTPTPPHPHHHPSKTLFPFAPGFYSVNRREKSCCGSQLLSFCNRASSYSSPFCVYLSIVCESKLSLKKTSFWSLEMVGGFWNFKKCLKRKQRRERESWEIHKSFLSVFLQCESHWKFGGESLKIGFSPTGRLFETFFGVLGK